MINEKKIIEEFKRIKALGFIKSRRIHDTGIGKTFEDYLGVDENNKKDPDFEGFEVKSHRTLSNSKITLFTKSPSFPKGANKYLLDKYGTPDENFVGIKNLHTSFYGNQYNTFANRYKFKLEVDENQEKVYLIVRDINDNQINENIYWTFKDLMSSFNTKLKSLFLVKARNQKRADGEYFHFTESIVYYQPDFNHFIKMLKEGRVMFDIRFGCYRSGKLMGKPHDHGSGFRFKESDLPELYDVVLAVS